jgi:hypothetical protein
MINLAQLLAEVGPILDRVDNAEQAARFPASMSACLIQPRNVSGFTPSHVPIRCTAAVTDSSGSSSCASYTSRIARSRNSCGYFLGAGMT